MGQTEFVDQPLDALRFLERIQVLALNILDQRQRQRRLIGYDADERRNLDEPRALGRKPAPLAGDDFIPAAVDWPRQDRLHDALVANRLRELAERFLVHLRSRLIAARADLVERERAQRVASSRLVGTRQQRIQSASESFEPSHRRLPWLSTPRPDEPLRHDGAFPRRAQDTPARP